MSNRLAAEPLVHEVDAESELDFEGWFDMENVSVEPPAWVFSPKKTGELLQRILKAPFLGRFGITTGDGLTAELTARREALKVRVDAPLASDTDHNDRRLSEKFREMMVANLIRRSIQGSPDEYLLHKSNLFESASEYGE